jgi:hypothetical protein
VAAKKFAGSGNLSVAIRKPDQPNPRVWNFSVLS